MSSTTVGTMESNAFGTLCGIIELTYQVYSINGIYDIQSKWKSFTIWLVSMIPAFLLRGLLLDGIVGPMIESSLNL